VLWRDAEVRADAAYAQWSRRQTKSPPSGKRSTGFPSQPDLRGAICAGLRTLEGRSPSARADSRTVSVVLSLRIEIDSRRSDYFFFAFFFAAFFFGAFFAAFFLAAMVVFPCFIEVGLSKHVRKTQHVNNKSPSNTDEINWV